MSETNWWTEQEYMDKKTKPCPNVAKFLLEKQPWKQIHTLIPCWICNSLHMGYRDPLPTATYEPENKKEKRK